MTGAIIKSLLKAGIDKLPDNSIKAQSLPNIVKKMQVNKEEMKFSGIELPTQGKVSKAEFQEIEAKRTDTFSSVNAGDTYQNYSLPDAIDNPTYRENVYTFSGNAPAPTESVTKKRLSTLLNESINGDNQADAELTNLARQSGWDGATDLDVWIDEGMEGFTLPASAESRYTSQHFNDVPNYLMHTRTYDTNLGGKNTRVVQEIQSDLHQAGRQEGYNAAKLTQEEADIISSGRPADGGTAEDLAYSALLREKGFNPDEGIAEDFAEALLEGTVGGIPESPYQNSWLSKGLEREIAVAVEQGQQQLAVPIKSTARTAAEFTEEEVAILTRGEGRDLDAAEDFREVLINHGYMGDGESAEDYAAKLLSGEVGGLSSLDNLVRAPGVQKWYENNVASSMQKIAKANGLPYSTEVVDGVEFAVLDLSTGIRPSFSLYSVEVGGAMMAYQALQEGHEPTLINDQMQKQGYTAEESEVTISQMQEAIGAGYSEEEIRDFLHKEEPQVAARLSEAAGAIQEPKEGTPFGDAYRTITGNTEMSPQELIAKMQVIAPNTSLLTTSISGYFGNEEALRNATASAKASEDRIVQLAAAKGLNLVVQEGEFYAQTEQGLQRVTPAWYQSFFQARGELVTAVAGGFAGAKIGAVATAAAPNPYVKGAGVFFGSLAGAVAGSIIGTEADYIHNAIILQEDFNAEIMARKALTAAEASAVGDTIGFGLFKIAGSALKHIVAAKRFIAEGSTARAKEALKENLFIDDDTATELVEKMSKLAQVPGVNKSEQQIAAAALSVPGAEGLVKASVSIDPLASASVKHAIDTRAKDVLKATASVADDNIGALLKGELADYTTLVKENFGRVKAVPAQSPRANKFSFKYNKLGLEPVLSRLSGNITNTEVAYKFAKQSEKIRAMSTTRTMTDLVELRSLVNDFKFNKRIRLAKDFDMINEVLANIDSGISQGAYATLDNPKQWLKDFADARVQYAKMKGVEANVIAKLANRPGVSDELMARSLAKHATAIDDTFVEILNTVPTATRAKIEGSVLNSMATKFTAGTEGGMQAVHFPKLGKSLEGVTFTSPEARTMKKALIELAEVFRNDIPLAQVAGDIQIQPFQSFLTADPVVRAKFEVASKMFNWVRSKLPGADARARTLVTKTARVLENPVNAKNVREIMEQVKGDPEILEGIEQLARNATMNKTPGLAKLVMFGDGKTLSAKGTGAKQTVPMHRVASIQQARTIAEASGINIAEKKVLDMKLKDLGYMAIQTGAESVRKF